MSRLKELLVEEMYDLLHEEGHLTSALSEEESSEFLLTALNKPLMQ